jgi:hypothetical protein
MMLIAFVAADIAEKTTFYCGIAEWRNKSNIADNCSLSV